MATTLQSFRSAFVPGASFAFHTFVWGTKPSTKVARKVLQPRSKDVVLSSWRNPGESSYMTWPKATHVVEHAPGVFWVLNDVIPGQVLVYAFASLTPADIATASDPRA